MAKRVRRTEAELITDLQAEIARLKQRSLERSARSSPDGRAFLAAVKALDKAIDVVKDQDLLRALEASRARLSEEVVRQGLRLPGGNGRLAASVIPSPGPRKKAAGKRVRRSAEEIERLSEQVKTYVMENPGRRLGQVGKALGLEAKDVRRPAFDLVEAGVLRTEGERGGTRYFPA